MSIDTLYWAYVGFVNIRGGKVRPVLLLRHDVSKYIVLRVTSKYKNKSKFIQSQYVEIKDWREAGLVKPSWIDTYKVYRLPIATTKLTYIGKLSLRDLKEISKHIDFNIQ